MSLAASTTSTGSALWFLSRGTGVVSLALLTLVMVLGVLTKGGRPLPGAPRFVTAGLHRNAAVLAVSLLTLHVLTAVLDPYAPIRLVDAIIPFLSPYRPLWLGLGALALDLLVAVIVTSLLRLRIGARRFRLVHWASYALWPAALLHGVGTGSDVRRGWMLLLVTACVGAVVATVLWRLARLSAADPQRRLAAGAGAVLAVPAIAGFLVVGPLAPHWAARAGTPTTLLHGHGSASSSSSSSAAAATLHSGRVTGRITQQSNGSSATVVLAGQVASSPAEQLHVVLRGTPSGGGISLSSGTVTVTAPGAPTWSGAVTGLAGGRITAENGSSGTGSVVVDVQTNPTAGTFDGTVTLA